jgi:hypothetical protein
MGRNFTGTRCAREFRTRNYIVTGWGEMHCRKAPRQLASNESIVSQDTGVEKVDLSEGTAQPKIVQPRTDRAELPANGWSSSCSCWCSVETRGNVAPESTSDRYSYPSSRTATPILVSARAPVPDSWAGATGLTTRSMWPRQRTRMFSPSVISDGMRSVISISEPSRSDASVKKKTPRELTSWVKPTPSSEAPHCRRESGRR